MSMESEKLNVKQEKGLGSGHPGALGLESPSLESRLCGWMWTDSQREWHLVLSVMNLCPFCLDNRAGAERVRKQEMRLVCDQVQP